MAQVILISQANPSHIGEFGEVDLQHLVVKWLRRDRYRTAARQPLSSVNLKHGNSENAIGANSATTDARSRSSPPSASHSSLSFILDQTLPARLATKVVRPAALLARVK